MKKILLLCLSVCLLVCLVGCGRKDGTNEENTDTGEGTVETYNICGNAFEEYKILKDSDTTLAAPIVRTAIEEQVGVTLDVVTTMPQNGKVIRFETNAHVPPASCRISTEGQALVIAVYDADFYKQAAEQFKALLAGGQKSFGEGYSELRDYERIAVSAVPASAKWKIVGDVDRDALSYATGDIATLNVAVIAGGRIVDVPYFRVETYNESTQMSSNNLVAGVDGVLQTKSTKLKRPGFFYWNITAYDQNKNKLTQLPTGDVGCHFLGSAGFSVDNTVAVTPCPEDFDTFWLGVATDVRNMEIERVTFKPVSGKSGYNVYYVELRCGTNAKGEPGVVSAYLTYPEWASSSRQVKLRITFQGHSIAPASPDYYTETATLSVCAHSLEVDKINSDSTYLDGMKSAIGTRFGVDTETGSRERMYFYQMLKRDLLGLRFLVEHCGPDGLNIWNGQDLIASGGSMGGFQSTVMAALSRTATGHDLSLADLSKPWLCDINAANAGRRGSKYCPSYSANENVAYYDTANFAHLITCEVQIYAGLGDNTCPAAGVLSFYHMLTCKKTLTFEQNISHEYGAVGGGTRYVQSAEAR